MSSQKNQVQVRLPLELRIPLTAGIVAASWILFFIVFWPPVDQMAFKSSGWGELSEAVAWIIRILDVVTFACLTVGMLKDLFVESKD